MKEIIAPIVGIIIAVIVIVGVIYFQIRKKKSFSKRPEIPPSEPPTV